MAKVSSTPEVLAEWSASIHSVAFFQGICSGEWVAMGKVSWNIGLRSERRYGLRIGICRGPAGKGLVD